MSDEGQLYPLARAAEWRTSHPVKNDHFQALIGTWKGNETTHTTKVLVFRLLVPLRVGAPAAAGPDLSGQQLEETFSEGGAAGGVEDEVDAEVRVLQLHEELLQVPHSDLVRFLITAPQTAEEGVHPDDVAVGRVRVVTGVQKISLLSSLSHTCSSLETTPTR